MYFICFYASKLLGMFCIAPGDTGFQGTAVCISHCVSFFLKGISKVARTKRFLKMATLLFILNSCQAGSAQYIFVNLIPV